jgi:hypothetical protein
LQPGRRVAEKAAKREERLAGKIIALKAGSC